MHPFDVEGVVHRAEELLVHLAPVERGIVLARHETDGLGREPARRLHEGGHAALAHRLILDQVGEIAGEDDEFGTLVQGVDGGDGLVQGALGIRVHPRTGEAEMHIGELHEGEVVLGAWGQGSVGALSA